jgi:putative membrane protein
MLQILVSSLLGCLVGMVTGLVPGLHVNTILPVLLLIEPSDSLIAFTVGVAISHTFFDFIPSVFLGVPDEASALSMLPAHRLVLRGRAMEAFMLTVYGGVFCSLLLLLLLPFVFALTNFQDMLVFAIPVLLLLITAIFLKKSRNAVKSTFIFLLAGALGVTLLDSTGSTILPMLSGFFGLSALINSYFISRPKIPAQATSRPKIRLEPGALLSGSLSGIFAGILPGVSSSLSAFFFQSLTKKRDHRSFLLVLGGTNTVYTMVAIFSIYIIGKPRSGLAIFLDKIQPSLILIIGVMLLSIAFSSFLCIRLSRAFVNIFNRFDFRKLNLAAMIFLVSLVFLFTGFSGMVILSVSTSLGLVCITGGIKRSACMGSLLLPALLYYLSLWFM